MDEIWAVSDGRAGIARQAQSLAAALSVVLEKRTGRAHPVSQRLLTPTFSTNLLAPWPNPLALHGLSLVDQRSLRDSPPAWIVGCGRQAAAFLASQPPRSRRSFKTIYVQHPRIPARLFDWVVAPLHDGVTGPNVIATLGAPIYFPPTHWADHEVMAAKMRSQAGRKLAILIGGASKSHQFDQKLTARLINTLDRLRQEATTNLWITSSRRTPHSVRKALRIFSRTHELHYWEPGSDFGANPYFAMLLAADAALVTSDSVNMICETASRGIHVNLFETPNDRPKFDVFLREMINRQSASWFRGDIIWDRCTPLQEGLRAAEAIVDQL